LWRTTGVSLAWGWTIASAWSAALAHLLELLLLIGGEDLRELAMNQAPGDIVTLLSGTPA